jgi:uncharacterized protein YidB (DUF937 family)
VVGLLDSLRGLLGGKGGSSQIMSVLGDLVESAGGVQGIMNKLEAAGLGDKLQSWIGTGENQPISGAEIERALGADEVRKAADKAGMTETEAADGVANALPGLIDKISPDGKLPDVGQLDDALSGLLKK